MTRDRNFFDLLRAQQAAGSHLCVGLDTNPAHLPTGLMSGSETYDAWLCFNCHIVDATEPFAAAFKPNIAFYEAHGNIGMSVLRATVDYIHRKHPHMPVIGDGKRADIGATNLNYVAALFDDYKCDAATVHAWHGLEAMRPFLERRDKGIIVVVRTSNPGADEFQKPMVHLDTEEYSMFPASLRGRLRTTYAFPKGYDESARWTASQLTAVHSCPSYQRMALRVAAHWNVVNNNCAVVAGATYPEDVAAVRAIVGEEMQILGPGFGKQAADVRSAIRALRNKHGTAFLGNSSSGITGASLGPDFAEAAAREAQKLHELFTQYRLEV